MITHHDLLLVRSFDVQTILCCYFLVSEFVRPARGPSLACQVVCGLFLIHSCHKIVQNIAFFFLKSEGSAGIALLFITLIDSLGLSHLFLISIHRALSIWLSSQTSAFGCIDFAYYISVSYSSVFCPYLHYFLLLLIWGLICSCFSSFIKWKLR